MLIQSRELMISGRFGVKPVWKVTAKQPFHVPKLRKDLYNNWSIFSGDIPFTNRFCLDLDIGMHFEVKQPFCIKMVKMRS